MASFIKKLFRGKSQEVKAAVETDKDSEPSLRFTDVVLTAPNDFGNDELGHRLQKKWMDHRGEPDATKKLLYLFVLLADVRDEALQLALRKRLPSSAPSNPFGMPPPTAAEQTPLPCNGHPSDFIITVWAALQQQFVDQFLSVDIETAVSEGTVRTVNEQTQQQTILLLETFNYLVSYPVNATSFHARSAGECAKILLLAGSSCMDEIESLEPIISEGREDAIQRAQYLWFLQVMMLEILCQLVPSRGSFLDYAGNQPWTFIGVQSLAEQARVDSFQEFFGVTVDECIIWPLSCSYGGGKPTIHQQQGEFLKLQFLEQFVEIGWFDYFFRLKKVLLRWLRNVVPAFQALENNQAARDVATYVLILQAECLHFFLSVLSERPSLLPTFLDSQFSAKELCSTLRRLSSANSTYFKLILRNMILLIRINSFISTMRETEITCLSLFELSSKEVSSLLVDINRRVTTVARSLGISSTQREEMKVVFEYFGKVGQVQVAHDLWPWNHDSAFVGSLLMATASAQDFHIVPPESLMMLKKLIHKHPLYLLWDNLISEVLGSTMLSESKPMQHKSSRVQPDKVHFLFEVFHELFHNIPLLEQCASSTFFPFLQIKYVDFISDLFKAAETSTIFSILTEFDTFRLLLGDYFLLAHKEIFHLGRQIFQQVSRDEPERDRHKLVFAQYREDISDSSLGWIFLHDTVMDYFHGLVIYSLYFLNSMDSVVAFRSYDDIMLVLLQYMHALLQMGDDQAPHDVIYEIAKLLINLNDIVVSMVLTSNKTSRDKIIFGIIECIELAFRPSSTSVTLKTPSQDTASSAVGLNLDISSDAPRTSSSSLPSPSRKGSANQSDFEHDTRKWMKRASTSALVELFINIVLSNARRDHDWIDAFHMRLDHVMIDFASEMLRLSKGKRLCSLAPVAGDDTTDNTTGSISPRGARSNASSLRKQTSSTSLVSFATPDVVPAGVSSGSGGTSTVSLEKPHRIRNSIAPIFYLLMDEHHHLAALQIIQTLVLACAHTINAFDAAATITSSNGNGSNSGSASASTATSTATAAASTATTGSSTSTPESYQEIQAKKQSLRALAGEAILVVLGFMGVAHKHADPLGASHLSLHAMNTIMVLLRDDAMTSIRITVQEIIRREKLLYEMLRAIARSLNGFDALRQKKDPLFIPSNAVVNDATSKWNPNYVLSALLRTSLSLTAAISAGNDLCKSEINHLVQGNREKIVSSRIKLVPSSMAATSGSSASTSSASGSTSNNGVPSIATNASANAKSATGLASLILCAERLPQVETITVLFDLLLDGPFGGQSFLYDPESSKGLFRGDDDRPRLKNAAILNDLMHLVPFCSLDVQKFALSSLLGLISGRASLINLNVCSSLRPKLIDSALDLFPFIPDAVQSLNAELIELLGRNNISVASLKHLFRVLQYTEGERPQYAWKIVQSLQGMYLQEVGPKHTFVFTGFQSGLKLPPIHKWPTLKGFAFCGWIKLESPKLVFGNSPAAAAGAVEVDDNTTEVYQPQVFCFRHPVSNAGIEFGLKQSNVLGKYRLIIQSYTESGERCTYSSSSDDLRLDEGKWYFIGVSLSPSKFYGKGETLLCVGNNFDSHVFNFAKLPDQIMEPTIGGSPAAFALPHHHHTLRGQMGAMYFFHEALPRAHFQLIQSLGPDYLYNFEPISYQDRSALAGGSGKGKNKVSLLEEAQLNKKILLSYNPVVLRGKYFLDNTPDRNEIKWKLVASVSSSSSSSSSSSAASAAGAGGRSISSLPAHGGEDGSLDIADEVRSENNKYILMHALKLPGTYRSTYQDVRLAINSLGGIRAIIPLFALVDKTVVPTNLNTVATVSSQALGRNTTMYYEANFFPAVLGLFNTMIADGRSNMQVFQKSGGFAAIRTLLERSAAENFNLITFNQFVALYSCLQEEYLLQDSLLENVLCNFKLWFRSACDVQLALFDWLIGVYQYDGNCNPLALSAQRLIDTCYQYLDYEPAQVVRELYQQSSTMSGTSTNAAPSPSTSLPTDSSLPLPPPPASASPSSAKPSGATGTSAASVASAGSASIQLPSGTQIESLSAHVSLHRDPQHPFFDPAKLASIRAKVFKLIEISFHKRSASLFEDIAALIRYASMVSTHAARAEVLQLLIRLLRDADLQKKLPSMLIGFVFGHALVQLDAIFLQGDAQTKGLVLYLVGLFLQELHKSWADTVGLCLQLHGEIASIHSHWTKSLSSEDPHGATSSANRPHAGSHDHSHPSPRRGFASPSASTAGTAAPIHPKFHVRLDKHMAVSNTVEFVEKSGIAYGVTSLILTVSQYFRQLPEGQEPFVPFSIFYDFLMDIMYGRATLTLWRYLQERQFVAVARSGLASGGQSPTMHETHASSTPSSSSTRVFYSFVYFPLLRVTAAGQASSAEKVHQLKHLETLACNPHVHQQLMATEDWQSQLLHGLSSFFTSIASSPSYLSHVVSTLATNGTTEATVLQPSYLQGSEADADIELLTLCVRIYTYFVRSLFKRWQTRLKASISPGRTPSPKPEPTHYFMRHHSTAAVPHEPPVEDVRVSEWGATAGANANGIQAQHKEIVDYRNMLAMADALPQYALQQFFVLTTLFIGVTCAREMHVEYSRRAGAAAASGPFSIARLEFVYCVGVLLQEYVERVQSRLVIVTPAAQRERAKSSAEASNEDGSSSREDVIRTLHISYGWIAWFYAYHHRSEYQQESIIFLLQCFLDPVTMQVASLSSSSSSSSSSSPSSSSLVNTTNTMSANTVLGSFEERMESLRNDMCFSGILKLSSASSTSNVYYASDFAMARDSLFASPSASGVMASTSTASSRMAFDVTWQGIRCVAHLLKSVSPYPHRTQWCFSMLHTLFRMMVNMMLNEAADGNDGGDITTITSLTGLGIFEILHILCLVFQLMFEGHFTRGNVAVDVASNGAEYDAMVHDVFQYLRVWCDSTLFSLVGGAASSSGRSPRSEKSLKVRTYLMRFVSIGEEVIRAEANGSSAGLVQQLVTIVEDGAVNILTELMEDVIAPSNWDYFLRYMQEDNTNLNTSAMSIPPPSPASSPSLTTGGIGGETSRRASVTNLASLLALSSGDMAADTAVSPEKNALLAQFLTDIVWVKSSSGATASPSASPRGMATHGQQLRSMMVVVDMVLQAARFMENEVCSMQIMESGFGDVLVDDSMLAGVPTAATTASRTAGATKASPSASADHLLEPTTPRGAVGTSTATIDDDATVVADKLPANYHLLQEQALLDHATLNSSCKDNVVGTLVPIIDSAAIINDEEDRYIHDCNVQVMSLLLQSEAHRLLDHFRITETNYKRCESKWTRIFSQLANERGPWGYGNEQHREVFWTLDHVLNSTHVKFRLRRNPFGSNHTIATKKSAGGSTPVGGSNNAAVMYTADEGDDDDADAKNRMGIYADLKRFKKSTIPSLDRGYDNTTGDNGNDDEDEDEGAAAVNGPSSNSGRGHSTAPDTTATAVATNDGFTVTVEVISVATNPSGGRTHGRLEISRHKLCFFRSQEYKEYDFINKSGNPEFLWACMAYPSTVWMAHDVTEVYRRRYQQRYVALEIFFANRTSVFINCFDKSTAKKVYTYLVSAKFRANAKYMSNLFTGNATSAIARITWGQGLTLTQAWVLRKISNFEYLMYLNFIAGRSFNDLAQYPVFPWILADYSSAKLDFKNPNTFRRLDLPIAAQLESQQRVLRDKYESSMELGDPDILPYHSGSHYSTSAMVLWYLLRMEPFTSLHVWLQEGRFDRPDRLFDSIERAYRGCTTNPQDVKELIPEFFFNPEFLSNVHHLDFGRKQDGQAIGDVELPRWCKDPADFVRQHREALESEYVSLHLHHWIDLIFGVKQRPPFLPGGSDKSVDAMNVFVHLSYADAVDLDGMRDTDPALYQRTIRQIDCYGQTPIQLFTKDHPPRKRLDEVHDLFWPIASIVPGADVYASSSHSSRHGKGDRDDPSGSSSASAGASSSSMSMTLSSSPSNASSSTAALTSAAGGAGSSNAAFEIDVYLDKPSKILCYGEFRLSHHPILFVDVQTSIERLITIDSGRILGNHTFQMRLPDNVPPYALKVDKSVTVSSHSGSGSGHGTGHGPSASSGSSSSSSGTTSSLTSFMMPGMNNREKVLGIPFAAPVVLSSTVLDRADATKYDWYEQAGELVGSRRNRSHYLDEESKAVRGLLYSSSGSPSSTGGSSSANGGGRSRSGTTTSMRAGSSSSGKSVTPPRSGSGKGAASSSASSANTSTFFAASSTAATSSSSKASITAKMKQLSDQDLMNEVIDSSSGRQATSASHHATSSGKTTLSASSLSSTSAASASAAAAAAAAAAVTHRRDRVDEHLSSQLFSVLLVSTSATATATSMVKFVFSCGHWDNTFKVTSLENGKLLQSIAYHREVVTCIATASDYGKSWVIAGSKDCTLTVWEVYDRESDPVSSAPLHTLYGHDDAINCLCVKASLDLIVSGSDDGTIILHSLREGVYLRSIAFGVMPSLTPNTTASSGDDAASSASSSSSTTTTSATAGSASSGGASSRSGRPMSSPSTPLTRKSGAASTPSPLQSSTSMNLRNNQTQSQSFSRSRSSTLRGGAATANASSTAANGADGAATDWSLTTVVGLNTSIASMQKVTKRVHMIQVTGEGHIVAYSHDFTLLAVYTLNGRFIRMISTRERLYALLVSDDSRVVLTGGERGLIVLRWLHNLSIANNGCRRGLEFVIDGSTDKGMEPFPSPIRCMTFTEKERHLIVGLESGEIRVLAQDSEYLQRKLHRRLMEIGILPT